VGKLFGSSWAMAGGLGVASLRLQGGPLVAALVVVNAVGDVVDPEQGAIVAGARAKDGGFRDSVRALLSGERPTGLLGENTTLAVVATDAHFTKAEATKVAQMAHDGLARTIRPAHTPWDGDTIFALATGRHAAVADPGLLGIAAAEVVGRAVLRAVRLASSVGGLPAVRDLRRA
jgi:L-aminopeptidase/D-esterase-like protein